VKSIFTKIGREKKTYDIDEKREKPTLFLDV